jgi:hypothetical protein
LLFEQASSNECIEAAVNGMDSILIAYGGEGSGKSCLLLGKQGLNHMWNGTGEGIIPRAAAELLGAGLIVQCMCLAVSDSRVVDTFGSPDPTERRINSILDSEQMLADPQREWGVASESI